MDAQRRRLALSPLAQAMVVAQRGRHDKRPERQEPQRRRRLGRRRPRVESSQPLGNGASDDEDDEASAISNGIRASPCLDKGSDGHATATTTPTMLPRKRRARARARAPEAPRPLTPGTRRAYEGALQRRDFARVLWLLANAEVPVDHESPSGETALLAAVTAKDTRAFALLRQQTGVSINASNRFGYTPLMKAVAAAAPFAEAAAAHGGDPLGNANKPQGRHHHGTGPKPPHHVAAHDDDPHDDAHDDADDIDDGVFDNRMVRTVLACHPDLGLRDHAGLTATDWARRTGNSGAIALIHAHHARQVSTHEDATQRLARLAECEALLRRHDELALEMEALLRLPLLQEGEMLRVLGQTPADVTLMTFTLARDDYRAITRLLGLTTTTTYVDTFFINRETREGWTPVTKAGAGGFVEAMRLLVTLGADLTQESTRHRHTALTWASYCGHEPLVLYLLREGVDLGQTTREGRTALMHAVANGQARIVRHLLGALREQSVRTTAGKEAFHPNEAARLEAQRTPRAWGTVGRGSTGRRKPGTEEWPELFLAHLGVRDANGRDALAYAEQRVLDEAQEADEVTGADADVVVTPAGPEDDDTGDGPSNSTPRAAVAIRRMLHEAIEHAHEHQRYVATHQARTEMTPCRHEGCAFEAPKDLLPMHELHACPKRRVPCERCQAMIVFEDRTRHEDTQCAERTVPCVHRQHGCHAIVLAREREGHERDHCRRRPVACRLGCDKVMPFDELEPHERLQCVFRLVECPAGCGVSPFPANRSAQHRRHECPKRLVPCTGGSSRTGGCGLDVPAEDLEFHLSTLCERRRLPCKWAAYGCPEALGGAPESRRHHEHMACPFRLVPCRHAGCALSEAFPQCFEAEHYAWQCPLEPKPCPNRCGSPRPDAVDGDNDDRVEDASGDGVSATATTTTKTTLAAHLLDGHVLSDAGDCTRRRTHCRLDLCGKHLRLFDLDYAREPRVPGSGRAISNDPVLAVSSRARVSVRALEQRLRRYREFIKQLETWELHAAQERREATAASTFESTSATTGTATPPLQVEATRRYLETWLAELQSGLERDLVELRATRDAGAVRLRVLSFSPETQKHLLEFGDGHSEWLDLEGCEYDVTLVGEDTMTADPSRPGAPTSTALHFQCGFHEAENRDAHEREACALRLIPCPLACGQRLTAQSMGHHLAKRCNLRQERCRLGCGRVLPFIGLNQHEDGECELRQVFCGHCHAAMPHRGLVVHVQKHCEQVPRRCRYGCGLELPRAEFEQHEAEACPKRMVPCPKCEKRVWYCELASHDRDECPLRVYGPCDNECGQVLRFHDRAHHLLYDCAMRTIHCRQCNHAMPWRELETHRRLLCPEREVYCRRGCGQLLRDIDTERHEAEDCTRRVVACPNRCGLEFRCDQVHEHTSLQCTMRVMNCPNDCGDRLFAYQFETHWKRCRQRLLVCGAGAKPCGRPIRLWFNKRRLVRCAAHNETGLLWALKTQDEELVTYFLQSIDSEEVHTEFTNGFAPLTLASSLGNIELVRLLLRVGGDVNQETSRGRTPLREACMARDPEMVELLIANRASVSHVNRHHQSVIALSESLVVAATSAAEASPESPATKSDLEKSKRVLELLKTQEAIERDQRDLFVAIATSDYDYIANLLKYSNEVSKSTSVPCHAVRIKMEAEKKRKEEVCRQMQQELDDALHQLHEGVADTETKTTAATRLRERVDDCKSQIARIDSVHDESVAESNALEVDMLDHIREITALDIAKLLNAHTPPANYLVVMKSICMFCGVMPRGRRNASEYTEVEWWKTAQALLMDRGLLQKLRNYRNQTVTPDVMAKVRRECLRTPAFAASTTAFRSIEAEKQQREQEEQCRLQKRLQDLATSHTAKTADSVASSPESAPEPGATRRRSQLPRRDALRGDIVGILATWVKGVEIEYKAKSERQTLTDKKRRLAVSLASTEDGLEQAVFDMHVAARSLPARQEEVDEARSRLEAAEKELQAATQRLRAYNLLQYASLNGHTPLTFAAAVGNEAMVHMMLTHGANAGYAPEERETCASLIQLIFRDFLYRAKQRRLAALDRSRSDEAIDALVRNVAHTFLLGHYQRKRRFFLQTHRVAIHEAIYNGQPQIVEILLSHDATLRQRTFVFPMRVLPGAPMTASHESHQEAVALRRRGGWMLLPLSQKGSNEPTDPLDGTRQADEALSQRLIDAAQLEQRLEPMSVQETLSHALWRQDCKTFLRDSGGWKHDHTRYSETCTLVNARLDKLQAVQAQQRQEILARKNVAKKTQALQELHKVLDNAIVARDFQQVSALLDGGAFADYETSHDGFTALMAACIEERYVRNDDGQDVLAVQYLLDRQLNHPYANFESSKGHTALTIAAFHGSTLAAAVLLERGADLNQRTRARGETALHVAAGNGQLEFVEYLLRDPRTDVFIQDADGQTAFDHATRGGFQDLRHVLGAAMGGNRGRVFSIESATFGVCKWGCGFMTRLRDHVVRDAAVLRDVAPLAVHEADACPKRIVPCPLDCGVPTLWAEALGRHLADECPLREVACPQPKCGARVVFQRLRMHAADECEFRTVHCPCGESMTHQRHVLHAENQCPLRLVPCPLQCPPASPTSSSTTANDDGPDGTTSRAVRMLRACDLKDHERGDCPHRRVRCRNGCTASDLLLKDREGHETTRCPLRRVPCAFGCGDVILAHTLGAHESDECPRRPVPCPNRCGATVLAAESHAHATDDCPRRLVLCDLGCGCKVPLHTLRQHHERDCRRRLVTCGGCATSLPELELPGHETSGCPARLGTCGLCGQTGIRHADLGAHRLESCRMRPVSCRFPGCMTRGLVAHALPQHEQHECAFRSIYCPLGCGRVLVAHGRRRHERECEMRIVACARGCGVELRERERAEHERAFCSAATRAASSSSSSTTTTLAASSSSSSSAASRRAAPQQGALDKLQ